MKREVAEQIVAAIKGFDQAWGQLDIALNEIDDKEERRGMQRVLLDMHTAGYSHITLPITRQFPELYPYSDQPSWFFEKFEPKLMIHRLDAGPRRSDATVHDERVYLSGVAPTDTSQDIAGQTRQVVARVKVLLEKAGSGRAKILSALIFLADMDDIDAGTRSGTTGSLHQSHRHARWSRRSLPTRTRRSRSRSWLRSERAVCHPERSEGSFAYAQDDKVH